ncbi:MAG: AAA family ATPase [Cyclobacteriaceae bacterium]
MITKISLNKVASYKEPTVLETDKKINLIYGLNGTGKSTLSDFLLESSDTKFKDCLIEGLGNDDEILVYNQSFIRENFFESESLKGIFTLSKENKEAEIKIANAEKEIKRISGEKGNKEKELQKEKEAISAKHKASKGKIWEIKQNYSGGDRVLEFCLEGYKSDGNKLLAFVEGLKKPETKPTKTIESIKEEVQALAGENAQKYDALEPIKFPYHKSESDDLFKKEIVGNKNSSVSDLINKLSSSDWVKDGLKYLPTEIETEKEVCPFCQESTISKQLFQSIKDYFDESYEADINSLKEFHKEYSEAIQEIPDKSVFENNPKYEAFKKDFELKYNAFIKVVEGNLKLLEDKLKSPSVSITLNSSENVLDEVNTVVEKINSLIVEHNRKIDQKETAFEEIKTSFWEIMRWDYDQTISSLATDKAQSQKNIDSINNSIQGFDSEIGKQKEIIVEQQKQTVNIEEAIININNGLIDLGIEDFKINHHSENLYKIVREQNDSRIFHSLSEGEKMIISFLYFLELCRGKKDATEAGKKKIIVIDDPISSLSHIYIFNVGRLIHKEFLRSDKYEQVFLLTHSLYFFYEMADIKDERRKLYQKLFRIQKNSTGSEILEMKYQEIQNDYHSYWQIIKDESSPKALIANCMRNILEYFFNFVEKQNSLNNLFQIPAMQENRFQAFYRYMDRESHSLGQNIFDIKEFNYDDFKDAFALVFKENGYEEHYKKMMK